MPGGLRGHGEAPAVVADEQSGDHDGDRPGEVQRRGERVAAHHQRERHHDLHLVVVDAGEHAVGGPLHLPRKRRFSVPLDMPAALLNQTSMMAFNNLYYQRVRQTKSKQRIDYQRFFYPLDGIGQWNRLYGKQGFLQLQFVIPKAAGLQGMHSILSRIASSRRGSFLAVL